MSLVNVSCTSNSVPISAECTNTNGKKYTFTIEKDRALIDSNGYIRFFTLIYEDGETHGYLLRPKVVKDHPDNAVINAISWTSSFLGSYQLSSFRGKLVRQLPKETHPGMVQAIDLGAYFLFSKMGSRLIQSFADSLFAKSHVTFAYHNVVTDNVAWTEPLRVTR